MSLKSSAFIENLSSSEGARARACANHTRNDAQKGCVMQLNGITLRTVPRKEFKFACHLKLVSCVLSSISYSIVNLFCCELCFLFTMPVVNKLWYVMASRPKRKPQDLRVISPPWSKRTVSLRIMQSDSSPSKILLFTRNFYNVKIKEVIKCGDLVGHRKLPRILVLQNGISVL